MAAGQWDDGEHHDDHYDDHDGCEGINYNSQNKVVGRLEV